MTRVDFYILPEDYQQPPLVYAARLVEKAFRRGHQIYVHTANQEQTEQASAAIWQQPDSFLAHECGSSEAHCPIQVSHEGQPGQHGDVMVNLAGEIPSFFSRFQRVAEIVPGNPESRSQCRNNFRYYRERGYALNTHNI